MFVPWWRDATNWNVKKLKAREFGDGRGFSRWWQRKGTAWELGSASQSQSKSCDRPRFNSYNGVMLACGLASFDKIVAIYCFFWYTLAATSDSWTSKKLSTAALLSMETENMATLFVQSTHHDSTRFQGSPSRKSWWNSSTLETFVHIQCIDVSKNFSRALIVLVLDSELYCTAAWVETGHNCYPALPWSCNDHLAVYNISQSKSSTYWIQFIIRGGGWGEERQFHRPETASSRAGRSLKFRSFLFARRSTFHLSLHPFSPL